MARNGNMHTGIDSTIPIKVWDLPTRLFHWGLVTLIGTSWITAEVGEGWMDIHKLSGYGILTLVLFRVVWGFTGSTHARFSDFVKGPSAVASYARTLLSRQAPHHKGHNPLGGWMIVLMLLLLFAQAGTGLFATDDVMTEGPLAHLVSNNTSDFITSIHSTVFDVLLGLMGAHIAAVFYHLMIKKENLIRPMVTGYKSLPSTLAATKTHFVTPWRAVALIGLAAVAVYALVGR